MITVYIPPSFISERSYVINTLLNHYCGLEIKILPRSGQLHYELVWEGKTIIIKDQFFGHTYVGESYLSPDRIPDKIVTASSVGFDNILILFGVEHLEITSDKIVSEADLFAGAFFMLTRWEESFGLHEDLHGRFPADKALVVKAGFILRPIVDEYVALLKKWLLSLGYFVPEDKSEFNVVPTCDVDIPYYWYSRSGWRILLGRALKHKSLSKFKADKQIMSDVKRGEKKDPYDTFDYLMTLAESRDLRFQFNMIGGGETKFEQYYTISDPRIISLMDEFKKRGHTIGLHPSYNAFNDLKMIESERKAVASHSDVKILVSRQHYLRFAIPDTWQKLSTAFIKEDSTLGYASEPGFRCGTSKSFPVFDIHQSKELPLIERPLLIMDVSLRFYKNFTVGESKIYCQQIIDHVKKHNGDLVILWHNSSLSDEDGWTGWHEVLEFLLS